MPHVIADVPHAGFTGRSGYRAAIERARTELLVANGLPEATPVSIVGFSAGGVAGVDFLRHHPQLVDRVVAVSSPLLGNEAATAVTMLFGGLAPQWVRDLSSDAHVLRGIDHEIGARITSIVGRPFDGLVSARSGAHAAVYVIRGADLGAQALHHGAVQTSLPSVRAAAWHALD